LFYIKRGKRKVLNSDVRQPWKNMLSRRSPFCAKKRRVTKEGNTQARMNAEKKVLTSRAKRDIEF